MTLMVWLYFIEGVVRATSDRGPGAAGGGRGPLCLVLFVACAVHVRGELSGTRRVRHERRSRIERILLGALASRSLIGAFAPPSARTC